TTRSGYRRQPSRARERLGDARRADRRCVLGTRSARLAVLAGLAALVAWGTPAGATTAPVFRPGLHLRAPSLHSSFPLGFLNNLSVSEPCIRVDSVVRKSVIAHE